MKQSFRGSVLAALAVAALILTACGGAAEPTSAPATAPAATPDPLAGWVEFSAPDGSFSVRLPSEPETQSETVPTEAGDIEIAMYITEGSDRMVMVAHNGFPAAVVEVLAAGDETTIQSLLDGGRDGAISNVQGTLQDEKQVTIDGHPAREFTFTVASDVSPTGKAITGMARVILTQDRLYQLLSLTNADETDPAAVQAFFDSFQLSASQ